MSGWFCGVSEEKDPQKAPLKPAPVSWCSLRGSTSLFALMFSAALASPALAETIVWVGSSTDDWFLPSNWYGYTRVPGPNDTAGFNSAGPTIAAGKHADISDLLIGIDTDGSLSVNGGLTTVGSDIGYNAGVTGKLNFSGGTWSNTDDITVGGSGVGELSLSGSSATSAGNIYVGKDGLGYGTVKLDNSSSFDNSGTVFVGYGGFGLLEVLGASEFTTGGLVVANGVGSMGTVSVEGAGSTVTGSGDMIIGGGGLASFSIAGGGVVISQGKTVVGNLGSSDGSGLRIDGAGSVLETQGTLVVGNEGAATMAVGTAATVTSGAVTIGRHSIAVVDVTGGGTQWTTGDLQIGGDASDPVGMAGYGTLNVKTGGAVDSASARLGNAAGATGNVGVDGSGSVWTVGSGSLGVGVNGTGRLTITGGGLVEAVDTVLGVNAGGVGSASISGSGSALRNSGNLHVGNAGEGSLQIDAGGSVDSDTGYVATLSGSRSSVIVDGGGSSWTVAKTLFVGYQNDAEGEVVVSTGGGIEARQITLGELAGSSGTMTIEGTGSNVTVAVDNNLAGSGSMNIGRSGSGSVTVFNGASLNANQLFLGAEAGSDGALQVVGAGSHAEIGNTLVIGKSGSGMVEVTGGGSLAATTIVIASAARSTGVLNIGAAAGQTARSAGEVEANAIAFGSGNGSIVLNHSESDYELSADISGAGRINAKNGVTTLSGNNSYSGGTRISAGTLKGTATSFGSGEIANNAQLVVDGAGRLSNVISGSGSFEKTGNGNLLLAGDNSYAGGTTISAGALTGTAKSFGSGNIVNNAKLNVDGAGTFSNVVSGTGAFEKTGEGNLVLSGNSTYSGPTEVSSGKLSVNGSLTSVVSVGGGAVLGGSGTIGGVTVASGGTLSPGNSIGTLTSTGDVTFASGSAYAVEIDASGSSDRLDVNGAITIDNNVRLVVTPLSNYTAYSLDTQYRILTATGGIVGTFSGVDDNFAYVIASVTKSADNGNAYLSFNRASSENGLFAAATSSDNARSAAKAVEALGEASSLYQAALFLQDGETQSAFSQLAGELHPSLAMALINRSQLTRDVILNRLRSAFKGIGARPILPSVGRAGASDPMNIDEGSLTFWSNGFGSRGHIDGDGNGSSVSMKGGGVFFGLDGDWGDGWRAGVAAGYGRDVISQKSFLASADVDSYYAAAYAGGAIGPASLRLGAIHAFQDVETRRAVSFSTLQENLTAGYDASTTQVFAEAAWRFDFDLVQFEPYANISYVNTRSDAFGEKGGMAAVSSGSASHDQLYSTLGARFSRDIAFEGMAGQAMFDIGWRHAYGDPAVESTLFYTGGQGFSVTSAAMAQDVALINLGLRYDLNPAATLTFRYGAVFGAGMLDQSASAELGVRF
ncbi:autotransporter domain-containing protein [Agrobacterium sp. V1]|uniref:autotransporter domain-containing protein n=1 Tax=Agrobacterium sp. V1 TaxID=3061957 RepID=UPI0026711B1A|nr:autotransporter domain-containing protein [Agrobacterium sp. V1]MDO3444127.1 autotransporter domain-containing protein [Agrobacterium sp. V1]